MRLFLTKLLLFLIPFILVFPLYVVMDPFKVLRNYDSYYPAYGTSPANINKDYVSTQNLLHRYKTANYNSFIFGSSRSIFYRVNEWSRYIQTAPQQCYHYDAFGESLYGITNKIKFLQKQQIPIKHALLIFDYALLEGVEQPKEYFRQQHPAISGKSNIAFHYNHFKAFYNYRFLKDYFTNLYGKKSSVVHDAALWEVNKQTYDAATNEARFDDLEQLIRTKGDAYYKERSTVFFKRSTTPQVYGAVIREVQQKKLQQIKEVFDANATDYRIVISPLYDQVQLNPEDLQFLQKLFGKEKVFDFSGINSFTIPVTNYYEESHYRPQVADSILKIIYSARQ